jgi:Concanavalin A-like lectin/glucanases superfamily
MLPLLELSSDDGPNPGVCLLGGIGSNAQTGGASSLLDKLVSYWAFETEWVDSMVASGNNLSSTNGVTQATGLIGQAATFASASNQFLSVSDDASLRVAGEDFTLAVWVNPSSSQSCNLWNKENGQGTSAGYRLDLNSGTPRFLTFNNGSVVGNVSASGALAANAWSLVIAWQDTTLGTVNIQVNNATPISGSYTGEASDDTSPLRLGAFSDGTTISGPYNGLLDEAGFWKSAQGGGGVLTASQRSSLYNSATGITYPFTGVP